jgi:hypothetical protein
MWEAFGHVCLPAIRRAPQPFSDRGGWSRYHLLPNKACSGRVGMLRQKSMIQAMGPIAFRELVLPTRR